MQPLIYNPIPFKLSTVRQVAEDKDNNMWFGCQNGMLVKWNYHKNINTADLHVVVKLNAIINGLFIDKEISCGYLQKEKAC
jgi:ligand-binding sensor domain-containing protein